MTFVGADLGGTKLAAAVFTDDGEIVRRSNVALGGREGRDAGALVADTIQEISEGQSVDAVGICVPGIYRSARGTVWAPNIPGWDDYPLLAEMRARLGESSPVTIDSDRAAYILGEAWLGAARGARDAIFIAVGTGIGAGILSGGSIVRGHGDIAGAAGWLALDRPFVSRYVQHGCFEDQASGPGLVRVAHDLVKADGHYQGPLRRESPADIAAADIFVAHQNGDRIAIRVLDNAIELWGMATANLVSIFNPEIIVFGGGIFGPAAKFLERIQAEAKKWAQPIAMNEVRMTATTLGADAGLYGAGRLAMMSADSST